MVQKLKALFDTKNNNLVRSKLLYNLNSFEVRFNPYIRLVAINLGPSFSPFQLRLHIYVIYFP